MFLFHNGYTLCQFGSLTLEASLHLLEHSWIHDFLLQIGEFDGKILLHRCFSLINFVTKLCDTSF